MKKGALRFGFSFLFLFTFPILLFTANSFAECLSFGPQQFTRQTGQPFVEQASFNNPNPLGGPYTLIIENGTESGQNRVSSAYVRLNGQELASPSDFNQNVFIIEKNIPSPLMGEGGLPAEASAEAGGEGENLLEVELQSIPGSYLTIRIVDADETPPALTIISPEFDPEWVNVPEITIAGFTDDPAATITVSSFSLTPSPVKITRS